MELPFWNESYETGDPVIDMQHRDLLALVAELDGIRTDAAGQTPFLRMLDRVMEFTWSHFEMEEALMTRVQYPPEDHTEMTEQHNEFKSYARLRVVEFHFGEVPSMQPFVPFLREWLTNHEFGLDKKLAAFIRLNRLEAAHART